MGHLITRYIIAFR